PAATNARRARATAPASSVRNEPTWTSKPAGNQIRGVARKAPRSTAAITRPRAETSQDAAPLRSTATGRSGSTRTRKVCGKSRSYVADWTAGSSCSRWTTAAPFSARRLVPSNPRKAPATCVASAGGAPRTSTRWTANIDVSRPRAYNPAATSTRAAATNSARPDGSRRSTNGGLRRGSERTGWATRLTSPRREPLLQRRQLQRAQELDLVLE